MLFKIKDFRYFSDTYCETGACWGASIQRAIDAEFLTIKSCEIHEGLYIHCRERFKEADLFLGSSTECLPKMLEDYPCVIFLDAHPAGPGTGGHEEWEKGNPEVFQQNILKKELEIILNHRKDHLIILDDMCDDNPETYQTIIKTANPAYTFKFFDEKLAPNEPLFRNKVMVCYPS